MGVDVRQRLPVIAQGHLPASLGRAKNNHLVAGGVLGGDAVRFLEHVREEVVMSGMPWALCAALGQHTHVALASSVVSLGLVSPFLPP
jgi:hypothetical protein